jgi:hypothetical protein
VAPAARRRRRRCGDERRGRGLLVAVGVHGYRPACAGELGTRGRERSAVGVRGEASKSSYSRGARGEGMSGGRRGSGGDETRPAGGRPAAGRWRVRGPAAQWLTGFCP